MLLVILGLLSGVILVILFILAIPVTVTFSVVRRESLTNQVIIGWLFGWIEYAPGRADKDSDGQGAVPHPDEKTTDKAAPAPTKTSPARSSSDLMKALLKTRGFGKRTIRFFQNMIGALHLRTLHLKGRIGLEDPYNTGRFWGLFSALASIIQMKQRVLLQFEPDFTQQTFEFDGHGSIRLIPLQMIAITTLFLLSPPTIRAAWTAVKWKRRRKI